MDNIILEDIVRIIIFFAIVIWYIYSLVKRARAKDKRAAQTVKRPVIENEDKGYYKEEILDDENKSNETKDRKEINPFEEMFPHIFADTPPSRPITNPTITEDIKYKENILPTPLSSSQKIRLLDKAKKKTYKQKNTRKDNFVFSNNPIIQGIIFSEIIGKSKSFE